MTALQYLAATIALVAFIVGAGWVLYRAAIIGDEQRRKQEGRE